MTNDTAAVPHFALIRAMFGDDEYPFRVGFPEAQEWEEKRDKSLMYTFTTSLQLRAMRLDDAREIIRIGLIGGGMTPVNALVLVKRYVEQRPIEENVELALSVMEAALFGSPEYRAAKGKADGQ